MIPRVTCRLIEYVNAEVYIFLRGHVGRNTHGSKGCHDLRPLGPVDGTHSKISSVYPGETRIETHRIRVELRKVWIGLRHYTQRYTKGKKYGDYIFQFY